MGGGGVNYVYLQNKYGRDDFQKKNSAEFKKTMIKIILKCGELSSGLIFQQIYYSITAISLPLL